MDGKRFDALARALATTGSRRRAMRAAVAAAMASLLGVSKAEAWPHPGGPCNLDGSCPLGEHCVAGVCECDDGATPCATRCSDLQNDPFNCGACGHACLPGVGCDRGRCACETRLCGETCCPLPFFCDPSTDECVPYCPDERRPCGIFITNQPICCPPGEACLDPDEPRCGKCPPDQPVCIGAGIHDSECCQGTCCNQVCCAKGKLCCGNSHCCDPARGFVCDGGTCGCKQGFAYCKDEVEGYCADLQNDAENCGACGHVCPAGSACRRGHCCPAKRACPARCCPPWQECCDDGTCKLPGQCCPKERVCGDGCCAPNERCCDGECRPAGESCACPAERDCSDFDLGCCPSGTYCGLDYDDMGVCCHDKPCGDEETDAYCCAAGDVCAETPHGHRCCAPDAITSDNQCCGIAALKRIACGANCCDKTHEVCIDGACCSTTMVAGGQCCVGIPPCGGKCCDPEREICASYFGGPERCVVPPPK